MLSVSPGLLLLIWGVAVTHARSVQHAMQKRSSVCYEGLDCFSNGPPFRSLYRPISFLPLSPAVVQPTFTLLTRQAGGAGLVLRAGDPRASGMAHFTPTRPTKFIVHGFIDNTGFGNWMQDMASELLQEGDYNVVIVDWAFGSLSLYGQATANTRVVGAMIAQLITFLQNTTGARPEDMHIIGHSLGAHIAGYAGERLRYLGRITGLDPAEPYFQNTDRVVRLDPTDALFVDVIHTDGGPFYSTDVGMGMMQACGHVDYYVNGGHDQPGCGRSPVVHLLQDGVLEGLREMVACNHLRSYHLFTETINSVCPFDAFRCASEDDFNQGRCIPCQGEGCGVMGLHADTVRPSRAGPNRYYLRTSGSAPFCRFHYKVTLTISSTYEAKQERGSMYVTVNGWSGSIGETKLNDEHLYIKPGSTYTYIVMSLIEIGKVRDVTFRWVHNSHVLDLGSWNPFGIRHPTLYLHTVTIAGRDSNSTASLCGHDVAVETGQKMTISTHC
ncbi:hypothetical protein ACOMHN_021233 [Nucella lapillus]